MGIVCVMHVCFLLGVFLENMRFIEICLHGMQDLTEAAVTATSKGCVWNQDLGMLLEEAGLHVLEEGSRLAGLVKLIEACPQKRTL